MILVFDWFTLLTPNLSLAPTKPFLVFCCWHWSSAIKYSSDFRKKILLLHTIIDRHLKNSQLPWSYDFDYLLIRIADIWSIARSNWPGPWSSVVITSLLLPNIPLVFETFLTLALHNWYSPDWFSMTLVFCCFLLIDSHCWSHIYCSHCPVPWSYAVISGLLISNIPLVFENLLCICTT